MRGGEISLSDEDVAAIRKLVDEADVAGTRYPEGILQEIAFPFLNGNIENNLRIPQHSLVGDLLQKMGINTKFGLNFLTLGFLKVAYAEKEINLVAL